MNKPILTVAILHYNRPKELAYCLEKTTQYLKKNFNKDECEIIVVDNASAAMLPKLDEQIILLKTNENIGVKALNLAFQKAKGKYILELDDDSYPVSGIDKAIQYLEENTSVGILGLTVKGENNSINMTPHLKEMTGFVGCGVIMRREMLQLTKGYAPWMFIYANEHELSMHARYYNYLTLFFAKASVFHMVAPSHRTSERLAYNSAKNYTISYLVYFSGIIGFIRTNLLQLLIISKITKDRHFFNTLWHTLRGFIDGTVQASRLQKKYLPRKVQLQIFLRGLGL